MRNVIRELSAESDYESRLFSGFQDYYLDRGMMFEPHLCMEMTYRRIEMQKQKQVQGKSKRD